MRALQQHESIVESRESEGFMLFISGFDLTVELLDLHENRIISGTTLHF